jgi:hypothetical protein
MFLDRNGRYTSRSIHSLIAEAFYGIRQPGQDINHIDGNILNNNITNLEYCTHSDNILHAYRMGLEKPMSGEKNGMHKLSADSVKYIRNFYQNAKASGLRTPYRTYLAEMFGVSPATIKDICLQRRNSWPGI